jgi:hypothetical protein
MKQTSTLLCALLALYMSQAAASSGLLFNVSATGQSANVSITLCLNGKASLSCQNYTVSALNLNITTAAPNHTYPAVGIKINTPGYALGNLGLDCAPSGNGYCLFSVSNTQSATISISKSRGYFISGTISNLTASGLVLQNNLSDNLSVLSGATTFQFSTPVAYGSSYSVTVSQQPTGLTCTVSNGSGTNVIADVTNISITCSVDTYTISGIVSNLTASGLVLQNNGSDNLSVSSGATTFQFPIPVAYGSSYSVTVSQQPTGLTCTVSNGSGTNVMANVTNIIIICDPLAPTISSVSPNIGSTGGGTTVTIAGTNLLNTTSVTFGSSFASIQVGGITETAVRVTAPAGVVGAVNVSVTTTDGSTTDNGAYTYATPGNATSLAATSGNLVFSGSALNWLGGSEGSYKVYYMNLPNVSPTIGQTIPSVSVSYISGKTFTVSSATFTVQNASINAGYYMFICDTATTTYTTGNCTNAVARS